MIKKILINGIVPTLDISKVTTTDFTSAYIQVAKDSGVDFDSALKKKDFNLYRLTRAAEQKKGTLFFAYKFRPNDQKRSDGKTTGESYLSQVGN